MKKIINILMIFLTAAIVFDGCKKDEKEPVLDTTATVVPTWIKTPAPDTYFVLVEDSADVMLTSLEWTTVVYPLTNLPDPLYTLELLLATGLDGGVLWNEPIELMTLPELTQSVTYAELNTAIVKEIGKEFPLDTIITAGFRIKANVNANDVSSIIDAFTDAAPFTVTPYTVAIGAPGLYVPGDHQGWDPATAPRVWSPDDDGVYSGFVYYPEGGTYEFKFTSDPNWDGTNYGAGATDGTLDTDPGAGNLLVPDFGGYILTCDINELTWTYEAQSWGVIGSGILDGTWSEDVDLEYDAANKVMMITIDVIAPPDGSELRFKFRANNAWTINLGQGDGENELSFGGPDIPMPEGPGNYTFILDLGNPIYTYEFIKN